MWIDSKTGIFTNNLLCMPINFADFSIGVIELTNKHRGCEYTEIDIKLVKEVCKNLATGLLQEEMTTNISNERLKEKQMERKLNTNNLKAYIPLFNNLSKVLEKCLSFQKAVIYLYDKDIDHLFSVPQVDTENETNSQHIKVNHLNSIFKYKSLKSLIIYRCIQKEAS